MAASRSNSSASNRQRTQTDGSSNALSFLERSHRSASSNLPSTVTSPWPAGFVPPSESKFERAFTWTTQAGSTNLPRTSALAFIERPSGGASPTSSSLGTGAGAETGLGWLSGGVVEASYGRGGFLPRSHSSLGGSGSWDSDEEMDSNVCPSMLFTCFPCLSCLRYDTHLYDQILFVVYLLGISKQHSLCMIRVHLPRRVKA